MFFLKVYLNIHGISNIFADFEGFLKLEFPSKEEILEKEKHIDTFGHNNTNASPISYPDA